MISLLEYLECNLCEGVRDTNNNKKILKKISREWVKSYVDRNGGRISIDEDGTIQFPDTYITIYSGPVTPNSFAKFAPRDISFKNINGEDIKKIVDNITNTDSKLCLYEHTDTNSLEINYEGKLCIYRSECDMDFTKSNIKSRGFYVDNNQMFKIKGLENITIVGNGDVVMTNVNGHGPFGVGVKNIPNLILRDTQIHDKLFEKPVRIDEVHLTPFNKNVVVDLSNCTCESMTFDCVTPNKFKHVVFPKSIHYLYIEPTDSCKGCDPIEMGITSQLVNSCKTLTYDYQDVDITYIKDDLRAYPFLTLKKKGNRKRKIMEKGYQWMEEKFEVLPESSYTCTCIEEDKKIWKDFVYSDPIRIEINEKRPCVFLLDETNAGYITGIYYTKGGKKSHHFICDSDGSWEEFDQIFGVVKKAFVLDSDGEKLWDNIMKGVRRTTEE